MRIYKAINNLRRQMGHIAYIIYYMYLCRKKRNTNNLIMRTLITNNLFAHLMKNSPEYDWAFIIHNSYHRIEKDLESLLENSDTIIEVHLDSDDLLLEFALADPNLASEYDEVYSYNNEYRFQFFIKID